MAKIMKKVTEIPWDKVTPYNCARWSVYENSDGLGLYGPDDAVYELPSIIRDALGRERRRGRDEMAADLRKMLGIIEDNE